MNMELLSKPGFDNGMDQGRSLQRLDHAGKDRTVWEINTKMYTPQGIGQNP